MQQLRRRQHGPHPVERGAHLLGAADTVAHVRGSDVVAKARARERVEHALLDEAPAGVVRARSPPRVRDDRRALVRREPQGLDTEADPQVITQRTPAIAHRLREHLGHAQVALDASRHRYVGTAHAHWLGQQVGEHDELDAGLAERREHLLDVAEEQPVGTDDEHALALEREPVRVEEVGGAVQGDDGLAGAGAALDDEHAGELGPDDLVLLALDGGDDVGEAAGAGRLDGA